MYPWCSWPHPELLPRFPSCVTYCHTVLILRLSLHEGSLFASISLPDLSNLFFTSRNYPLDMCSIDLRPFPHHHLHNGPECGRGKPNNALLLSGLGGKQDRGAIETELHTERTFCHGPCFRKARARR